MQFVLFFEELFLQGTVQQLHN